MLFSCTFSPDPVLRPRVQREGESLGRLGSSRDLQGHAHRCQRPRVDPVIPPKGLRGCADLFQGVSAARQEPRGRNPSAGHYR